MTISLLLMLGCVGKYEIIIRQFQIETSVLRPIPTAPVIVKCWKVAHQLQGQKADKKNYHLEKSRQLLPKFLDIFYINVTFFLFLIAIIAHITQENQLETQLSCSNGTKSLAFSCLICAPNPAICYSNVPHALCCQNRKRLLQAQMFIAQN